jgi:uncharacterized protein (TIGR03032 family)
VSESSTLLSKHTRNFPALLTELGISLLVTTYQAGKLVILRADGNDLNTHFRTVTRPMGLALDGPRLAIGTTHEIGEFRNVPSVAPKLPPAGRHDACFLPRRFHVTGDINVHELAWGTAPTHRGGPELWIVNTRFSCLCTIDNEYSFVPRWRPPFITALAPEDRCHLNGMCLVGGVPRFVTALGATDTQGGWRANKANGGVLMDVAMGATILGGLSMPHSPRWYANRLWLLESGDGSLGFVDPSTGRFHKVAEMPGFTRGMDFCGPVAFIGLSQVRETAVFSGIPITQRLSERTCGVWAVHIDTGQVLAYLQFDAGVREIFAVSVLPGFRYPDLIHDSALVGSCYFLPPKEEC